MQIDIISSLIFQTRDEKYDRIKSQQIMQSQGATEEVQTENGCKQLNVDDVDTGKKQDKDNPAFEMNEKF